MQCFAPMFPAWTPKSSSATPWLGSRTVASAASGYGLVGSTKRPQALRCSRNSVGFVEELSQHVSVFNMHGSYLSLALSRFGMSGISHGVGYGEQKDVIPVIGQSTPTVRYYLPDLKRRLGVPQIERALSNVGVKSTDDFVDKICGCVICRGVLGDSLGGFSSFGDLHYSTAESRRMAQTPAAAKAVSVPFPTQPSARERRVDRPRSNSHFQGLSKSLREVEGSADYKWRRRTPPSLETSF